MSYILEALRKSEQEKQIGEVPTLKAVHPTTFSMPDSNKQRYKIIFIFVMLIVNMVLMTAWLSQRQQVDAPPMAIQETPVAPPSVVSDVPEVAVRLSSPLQPSAEPVVLPISNRAVPDLNRSEAVDSVDDKTDKRRNIGDIIPNDFELEDRVPEKSVSENSVSENRVYEERALEESALEESALEDSVPEDEPSESALSSAPQYNWNEIPFIGDLPQHIASTLPDLELTSHLFSSVPEARSIIIDGRHLKEQQWFNGDIEVVEIVEQGVILQTRESFFRLYID